MALMVPGRHADCVITGSALKRLENEKQTAYIAIAWLSTDGESVITSRHWITEAAWQYTEQMLLGLGWDPAENGDDITLLNTGASSPLAGKTATLVVVAREYPDPTTGETKTSIEVKSVYPAGGVVGLAPEEAKKAAESFRVNLRAWSGRSGVVPRKAPSQAPVQAPADGIDGPPPF